MNADRKDFFIRMPRRSVPENFVHEPASDKPAPVTFPDELTEEQQEEVKAWRHAEDQAELYAELGEAAQAKADEYIAYEKAYNAWRIADALARENQWHWMVVDSAIMTYMSVPPSASSTGEGSGGPASPVVRQEPDPEL